jgi:predicted membrane protein
MEVNNNLGHISRGLIFGVIILLVGVTLLFDQLGIISAEHVFRFWPMILVVFGLFNVFGCSNRSRHVWGGVLILMGVLLQLEELGISRVGIQTVWPIFIIGIGVVLVMQAFRGGGGKASWVDGWRDTWKQHMDASTSDARLNSLNVFGGGATRVSARNFQGGDILAIFGGFEIDFSKADIEGEEAVLEVITMFGGGELRVPENWNVTVNRISLLGGYSDKTHHPLPGGTVPVKKLIIRGISMFGGLSIKN